MQPETALSLPLPLVDAVVALVPLVAPGRTPTVTLLNVLSPSILSNALCTALIDAANNNNGELSAFDLKTSLTNFAKQFLPQHSIRRLIPALNKEPDEIGIVFLRQLAGAGHLESLEYLLDRLLLDAGQWTGLLDVAAAHGRVDVFEWWTGGKSLPIEDALTGEGIQAAVRNGHLPILKWIGEKHPAFPLLSQNVVNTAASSGHIPILEWCLAQDGETENFAFDFTDEEWSSASANGHVPVLKWGKQQSLLFHTCVVDSVDQAISNGHIPVLEWWYQESSLPFQYSVWGTTMASKHGHVHVLEWLAASGVEFRFSREAKEQAIANKHHLVVQWWERNVMYNYLQSGRHKQAEHWRRIPTDFATLCSFGQVDLIDPNKIPSGSSRTMIQAFNELAFSGQIDLMQRYHSHFQRSIISSTTAAAGGGFHFVSQAVRANHVQVLQYCQTFIGFHGVPITKWLDCAILACQAGHVDVLDWMFINSYLEVPVSNALVQAAMMSGRVSVLDLLFRKGLDQDVMLGKGAVAVLSHAAFHGQLACLQWWIDKQFVFPAATEIADAASKNGHWLTLEWLCSMQPTVPFVWSEYAIRSAVRGKHAMTCKWWLRSGKVTTPLLTHMLQNALV